MRILRTKEYDQWFRKLRDKSARQRIHSRIQRIKVHGHLVGDYKFLGDHVYEMRFNFGPGYRVYLSICEKRILLLLIGGNKETQQVDIEKAKRIAREWRK